MNINICYMEDSTCAQFTANAEGAEKEFSAIYDIQSDTDLVDCFKLFVSDARKNLKPLYKCEPVFNEDGSYAYSQYTMNLEECDG